MGSNLVNEGKEILIQLYIEISFPLPLTGLETHDPNGPIKNQDDKENLKAYSHTKNRGFVVVEVRIASGFRATTLSSIHLVADCLMYDDIDLHLCEFLHDFVLGLTYDFSSN